jgi:hypothetical protein
MFRKFLSCLPLLTLILIAGPADAGTPSPPAPAEPPADATESPRPEARIAQLQELRSNLKAFLTGEKLIEVPPAALFSVDLSDEQAVQRRVQELRRTVGITGAPAGPESRLRELEREVAALRLLFLSLPAEQRSTILAAEEAARTHKESADQLAQERSSAEAERGKAARSIEAAEEMARTARSSALRELASQRAILERVREELANRKVRWTTSLEERNRFYLETARRLSALASGNSPGEGSETARQRYEQGNGIWRDLVDRVFSQPASPEIGESVPVVPPVDEILLKPLSAEPDAQRYLDAHRKVVELHRSLLQVMEKGNEEERNHLYRLLLQSGELRSRLLQEYTRTGGALWTQSPGETFEDLLREIRIVPYRFIALFYARLVDIRQKATAGVSGLMDIFRQVLLFLALLALPYATYKALHHLRWKIDRARARLVTMRDHYPSAGSLALLLRRVNPYITWIIMLLGVFLTEALVANTDFVILGMVLPYASFYIVYRIFRIFASSLIGMVVYTGKLRALAAEQERIQRAVRRVGRFFFLAIAVLYATKVVVGKALVYGIVSSFMLYFGTLVLFGAARQWRGEIGETAVRVLSETAGERIRRLCTGKISSWVVCFPALVLVILAASGNRTLDWATRFDLLKRADAELFRRRLIGAADKETGDARPETHPERLPPEYLRWFDLHAPPPEKSAVETPEGIAPQLRALVEAWSEGQTEEHSVILFGDKGSGKTTLLHAFAEGLPVDRVIHAPLPSRLLSRDQVLAFFGERLGTDLSTGPPALYRAFTGTRKTVLLIDDAQNLFLSALGGFEGYRTLGDLINVQTDSLFWVAAINRRSWDYLEGVFGKNQWFRRVFEAPPWSDTDIRRLILSRHELSGLRLSYDTIIRAMQSSFEEAAVAQLEAQFFRLLWGQSRGNPRAAIVLWLSALSVARDGSLRVGIHRFQDFHALEDAGDDTLFVFSSIIRHENLAIEEIARVADLPERVVRHAIRLGVENGLVARFPDGRYRATPEAQSALNQYLERRNFLHG